MAVRYHTRVIVVVHSHISGELDLSRDVIELNTSKAIKGVGSFSLTLVPRKNYLNLLFPNDVVNIYIDPGDGERGFVRTVLGYIDRVERTETVNEEGAMQTAFTVVGSDFAKAIERTEVYCNQHLAMRQELLDSDFGKSPIGGHALRTKGLIAHGTPASMIENLLHILLGFGAQWVLPESYKTNTIEDVRENRQQRALQRVPKNLRDNLKDLGIDISQIGPNKDVKKLFQEAREARQAQGGDLVLSKEFAAELFEDNSSLLALNSFAMSTGTDVQRLKYTILDLMDLSFIESLAIDGYISSASVWNGQGSLLSILYGYTNEMVNELCFDLRPVVDGSRNDACFGDGVEYPNYSTKPDELGINTNGHGDMPASRAGTKYRPAVVFREYPYSTVEGLDLTDYFTLGSRIGFIPFGPIFAKDLKNVKQGRVVYDYNKETNEKIKTLAPDSSAYDPNATAMKHLDIIKITNKDVTGSQLGRSDHDIFNLFALFSNDVLSKLWQFIISDFMPIITKVSIERNGLRVFLPQTKYANYSGINLTGNEGSAVDDSNIRRNLVRWALLLDHWNQHNIEYVNGTINLRGMPELRVGYRLDWEDRKESYYVEQVSHSWKYPGAMTTTIQVSRGQRKDPYPVYVPPTIAQNSGQQTKEAFVSQKGITEGTENESEDEETPVNEIDTTPQSPTGYFSPLDPVNSPPQMRTPCSRFKMPRPCSKAILADMANNRPVTLRGVHGGNDYRAISGQPVRAVKDGTVIFTGYEKRRVDASGKRIRGVLTQSNNLEAQLANAAGQSSGYGIVVGILHSGNIVSFYSHLKSFSVTKDQLVSVGTQIAEAGDSGNAKGDPQLHFEIRQGSTIHGTKVDPWPYVSFGTPEPFSSGSDALVPVSSIKRSITPSSSGLVQKGGGDRTDTGRLGVYFPVKDTRATLLSVDHQDIHKPHSSRKGQDAVKALGEEDINVMDTPDGIKVIQAHSKTPGLVEFAYPRKNKFLEKTEKSNLKSSRMTDTTPKGTQRKAKRTT